MKELSWRNVSFFASAWAGRPGIIELAAPAAPSRRMSRRDNEPAAAPFAAIIASLIGRHPPDGRCPLVMIFANTIEHVTTGIYRRHSRTDRALAMSIPRSLRLCKPLARTP